MPSLCQPISRHKAFHDLTGKRFGHLFIVGFGGRKGTVYYWWAICSCGKAMRTNRSTLYYATNCGCRHGLSAKELILQRVDVDQDTGCWNWTGPMDKRYGNLTFRRKQRRAHRVSFEIFNGPCDGKVICHICDNTRCVNPRHLFAGTQADNVQDCVRKNRQAIGSRLPITKLTEDDVRRIRLMRSSGASHREIAESIGVGHSAIGYVLSGKTFRYVV